MTGQELRVARDHLGWTQKEAAGKLGVSQPYLSLLENGLRPVPASLVTRLAKRGRVPPTALPLKDGLRFDSQSFAASLGAVGYPGFGYLAKSGGPENPATLLLTALRQEHLEPRLTESLPWLLFTYSTLDWDWLVHHAKQHNLQNRLGFLVGLAREVAEKRGATEPSTTLAEWERTLEDARLAKVDVLARRLTSAERDYFQVHRSPMAMHWNLLTGLTADTLRYGA